MVKWLGRNKNRILSLVSAFVIGVSFLGSGIVVEAEEDYKVEDKNDDNLLTWSELGDFALDNIANFIMLGSGFVAKDPAMMASASAGLLGSSVKLMVEQFQTSDGAIATIEGDKIIPTEEFQALLDAMMEYYDSSRGYVVIPAVSKEDFLQRFTNYYNDGLMSSSEYMNAYNAMHDSSTDYTGAVFFQYVDGSSGNGEIIFGLGTSSYDFCLSSYNSYYYIDYIYASGSSYGSSHYGSNRHLFSFTTYRTGYSGKAYYYDSEGYEMGCIDMPLIVFNSIADYVIYLGGSGIYTSTDKMDAAFSLKNVNATDWGNLTSTLRTSIQDAVNGLDTVTVTDIQNIVDEEYGKIQEALDIIIEGNYDTNQTLDEILEQLTSEGERQTSWLKKIYDLLCQWFPILSENSNTAGGSDNTTEEDTDKTDQFEQDSTDQSDKLDDLNNQTSTDKVDPNDLSNNVDSYIDYDSINTYGGVLLSVTGNERVLMMLGGSVGLAIIAYILFGKR